MKNIKKLILPITTIAASSAIVAPLLTSCSETGGYTDVTWGYTPKMTQHDEATLTISEAINEYLNAIVNNPKIVTEDYKYYGSQLNSFLQELDKATSTSSNASSSAAYEFKYKVESFKARLTDFVLNQDSGQVSYSTGLAGKFSVDFNLPETDSTTSEVIAYHKLHFDLDLTVEQEFVNMSGLSIKHASSLFSNNETFVSPVWPTNLDQTDWSFGLSIVGTVYGSIDGSTMLDWRHINIDKTFNSTNYWLLQVDLLDILPEGSISNLINIDTLYLMDVCTFLGSWTSYYMANVTCKQRFEVVDIPEFAPYAQGNTEVFTGKIIFKLNEPISSFNNLEFSVETSGGSQDIVQNAEFQIAKPIMPADGDEFTFNTYVDPQGKEHDDMCYVNVNVLPGLKETNKNKLDFVIKCYKSNSQQSYEWTETHSDACVIDFPNDMLYRPIRVDYQTGTPSKYGYFPARDTHSTIENPENYLSLRNAPTLWGCTINFEATLSQKLPAGSQFRIIGTHLYYVYDGVIEATHNISVYSIQTNYQEFTDYVYRNGVIYTTKEIESGTRLSITVNYPNDGTDEQYEFVPMIIPADEE